MHPRNFFAELKRRNVYKVAVAYTVVAWLLIQAGSILFPIYEAPAWVLKVFVAIVALGFPIALVIAWAFEMTPEGMKRTEDVSPNEKLPQWSKRKFAALIVAMALIAGSLLAWQLFRPRSTSPVEGGAPATPDRGLAATRPSTSDKSIAVVPLVNQSGDPNQEYFSDGLSEELINVLGQIRDLRVIGRNSSFRFKGKSEDSRAIGDALRVANVLEGSVRKAGDRVRISLQLVDTANDSQRWSQSYDRELKDVFAVQEEIAKSVAEQLRLTLLGSATTALARPSNANLDAYNAYLQGKFYFAHRNAASDTKAVALFEEAIRLDPNYAEAYLALSRSHSSRAFFQGVAGREEYELGRQAALKAVALKPGLAEARAQIAYYHLMVDWDLAAAERELASVSSEETTVLVMRALVLRARGDPAGDLALQRKVIDSDPLWVTWYTNLASTLIQRGQYDDAESALRKALELQPAAQLIHANWSLLALLRGQADVALREAELEALGIWHEVYVALAHHARGDEAGANAALDRLIAERGDNFPLQIALVYAGRRESGKLFEWLDRAYTARQPLMAYYTAAHPLLKPYYGDPRFVELSQKTGFPVPK
ncbi:MAG: tetratricopeptide repeat protein [Chthoniobacterales bacterium]